MVSKTMIVLAVASFVGAMVATTSADAQRGFRGGGGGGGFRAAHIGGGGFGRMGGPGIRSGFAGPRFGGMGVRRAGFVGPRFAGVRGGFVGPRRFAHFHRFGHRRFVGAWPWFVGTGIGLGLAASYYNDSCWTLTPWGWRWVCGPYSGWGGWGYY